MTKLEMITTLARNNEVTQKKSAEIMDQMFDLIRGTLKEEGRVTLRGFGTFARTVRAPRKGRNPRTGEIVELPEAVSVKFKASKELKESLK